MKIFPANVSLLGGAELRPLTPADVDSLHAITNHPKIAGVISFLSYPVPRSFADEWVQKNTTLHERVYGIFFDNDQLVGQIGVHSTKNAAEIEIGYWIGVDSWGKGIATKATVALASKLQQLHPKLTIIAECLPENLASLRVLEKSGFVQTNQPGHRPGRTRLIFNAKGNLARAAARL